MTQKTEEKINNKISDLEKKVEKIRNQLQSFLSLIPEECIEDYEDPKEIKKAYLEAIKEYPLE